MYHNQWYNFRSDGKIQTWEISPQLKENNGKSDKSSFYDNYFVPHSEKVGKRGGHY